jgi:hypothetical protein
MPTIQLQAQLSAEDLLQAVGQLESAELNRFVARVLALRAQRDAHSLTASETELLRRINQGLPQPLRARYRELIDKRRAETLTPEEHAELLRLTDQVEIADAERAQALVDLARLRQKSLAAVMHELGIPSASDD